MANRFFLHGPLGPGPVSLDGPEAHHLSHVRRIAVGGRVVLFNGDGSEYPAEVVGVGKRGVELVVTGTESPDRELGFRLHLAAAMPKGDRGDFLIEKLTEMGVTDFTPLHTERSVVKVDAGKLEKLRRAVIEASKQCGRNRLMTVQPAVDWSAWCVGQAGDRWIAHPGGNDGSPEAGSDRLIAVGPEGGFSEDEVRIAVEAGWRQLSLGPRILRVETAALTVAARVQ